MITQTRCQCEEIKPTLDEINKKLNKLLSPENNDDDDSTWTNISDNEIRNHHSESIDKLYLNYKYYRVNIYDNYLTMSCNAMVNNKCINMLFIINFTDIDKYTLQVIKYNHISSYSYKYINGNDSVYNLSGNGKIIFANREDNLYDFIQNVIAILDAF